MPDRIAHEHDVAIQRGLDGWPAAVQVRPWLEDEAVIVGAPALLRGRSLRAGPGLAEALAGFVLIGARSRHGDWADWLRQAGLGRFRAARRLDFDHLHLVLQAAVDGLGLALAPRSLLGADVIRRRLAVVLPLPALPLERYYCGVVPDAPAEARIFMGWLDATVAAAGPRGRPDLREPLHLGRR